MQILDEKNAKKMHFFTKCIILDVKSNILSSQIILFYEPPCKPENNNDDKYPKAPARESVVTVTNANRNFDPNLVRNAVALIYAQRVRKSLIFEQRVNQPDSVSFRVHIVRFVNTIDPLTTNSVVYALDLCNRHDLRSLATAQT